MWKQTHGQKRKVALIASVPATSVSLRTEVKNRVRLSVLADKKNKENTNSKGWANDMFIILSFRSHVASDLLQLGIFMHFFTIFTDAPRRKCLRQKSFHSFFNFRTLFTEQYSIPISAACYTCVYGRELVLFSHPKAIGCLHFVYIPLDRWNIDGPEFVCTRTYTGMPGTAIQYSDICRVKKDLLCLSVVLCAHVRVNRPDKKSFFLAIDSCMYCILWVFWLPVVDWQAAIVCFQSNMEGKYIQRH